MENENANKANLKKRLKLLANGTKIISKTSKFDRAREFEKDGSDHLYLNWHKNKITGYEGPGDISLYDFISDFDDFEIISIDEIPELEEIIVNGKKLTNMTEILKYMVENYTKK